MNNFGGDCTKQKIEIVVSYAKAYLTVMNPEPIGSYCTLTASQDQGIFTRKMR